MIGTPIFDELVRRYEAVLAADQNAGIGRHSCVTTSASGKADDYIATVTRSGDCL